MTDDELTKHIADVISVDTENRLRNSMFGVPYPLTRDYVIESIKNRTDHLNVKFLVENGITIDSEIALLLYNNIYEGSAYFWWESNEDIYRSITEHMNTQEKEKFTTTIKLLGIYP